MVTEIFASRRLSSGFAHEEAFSISAEILWSHSSARRCSLHDTAEPRPLVRQSDPSRFRVDLRAFVPSLKPFDYWPLPYRQLCATASEWLVPQIQLIAIIGCRAVLTPRNYLRTLTDWPFNVFSTRIPAYSKFVAVKSRCLRRNNDTSYDRPKNVELGLVLQLSSCLI